MQAQHEIEREVLKWLFLLCKRNRNTSFCGVSFQLPWDSPVLTYLILYKVVFYDICLPRRKLNAKFIRLLEQLKKNKTIVEKISKQEKRLFSSTALFQSGCKFPCWSVDVLVQPCWGHGQCRLPRCPVDAACSAGGRRDTCLWKRGRRWISS